MTINSAAAKKLARWEPRLQDPAEDVRKAAVQAAIEVAGAGEPLASRALDLLTMTLINIKAAENSRDEVCSFIVDIMSIDEHALASSPKLIQELLTAPTGDPQAAQFLLSTLRRVVEGGHLLATSDVMSPIVDSAKSVAALPPKPGRADALRILDWFEDSGTSP